MKNARSELYKRIAIAAEILGADLSEAAAKYMAEQLSQYPDDLISKAVDRCANELRGGNRLTISEILSRIDDGRPGPDEAWGMITWDEQETVVITSEMQKGQQAAWALWPDDKTGARMAFKECYLATCQENRADHRPIDWQISLGWDKTRRAGPIQEALAKGRIAPQVAQNLLPSPDINEIAGARLLEQIKVKAIA